MRGEDLLRVLHVVDSLKMGGTEWQCVSLAKHLDSTKFRNVLFCFNQEDKLAEALRGAGVTVEVVPFPGFRKPAFVKSLIHLAALMRQGEIHVVQAYGFYSNVPALLAGWMTGVPILVASRRDMGEFLTRLTRFVERAIFRLANRVVVNAKAIREELVATGQARDDTIMVIPTGIDLERFDRLGHGSEDRGAFGGANKIVGMVAKFRGQKDHTTFLLAAKKILMANPTVRFVLAGDGRRKEASEQFAREMGISSAVRFVGAVDPDAMPAFLRHVDVSVLASKGNEGIPNVILEAMAAGKPVVATDVGGCREAIQDGVTGFLVPPGDPEQLAEKILWLLREDGQAALMGKAGRERVETEFSLDRMVERFSSLYADLAHQKLGWPVEAK